MAGIIFAVCFMVIVALIAHIGGGGGGIGEV